MKKLLSATLAIAMGATCVWSLAACNGDPEKDAETAQKAINSIKTLYDKPEYAETDASFQVLGKASDGTNLHDVTWTVSTESTAINDITEYIKIGTELDADYQLTVSVTRPTVDVEYKLTASVTVGSQTATYTFTRTLLGLDESDVFTVAKINALDTSTFVSAPKSKNGNGNYYSKDGTTAAVVTIKGYVVDPGTYSGGSYKNYNNIYIVDDYSADKNKDSEGALQVFRIQPDGVYLKDDGSTLLRHGDYITVQGCIELYSKVLQVSYASGIDVKVTGLKRETSPESNVAAAKAAVTLASSYTATEVDLPTENSGASLTWEVKSGTNVTISGNKMTVTNPDAEVSVTVTVTIKCGTVTDTKDITFKVVPTSTKGTAADPYNVAEVKVVLDGLSKDQMYQVNGVDQEIYVTGIVVNAGVQNGTYGVKNVYIADSEDADESTWVLAYNINYGAVGSAFESGMLDVGDTITIKGYLKNYGGTKEICQSSSNVYPTITSLQKVQLTDAQKVQRALAALGDTLDSITATGQVTLPTSTIEGVTFVWSTEDETYTVVDGTKLNVEALPASDTEVTLTVTANCGEVSENNTKTVKVTINSASTTTAELSFSVAANRTETSSSKQVWSANGITLTNTGSVGDYTNPIRVYKSSTVVIECTNMTKIVFVCNTDKTSYTTDFEAALKKVDGITVSKSSNVITVTFATPCNSFTFTNSEGQTRWNSLTVTSSAA